ncbi:MAG: Rieske 2Fe-2S domain-containing protein [Alphaproteobacteria bacterium]|nr:Rieske 2Fe-2S domain-containing protein [Alphaproteobacteria bacterium]
MATIKSYAAEDLADINTPLLYDYWYVAGLADEFTRALRERTILNRSLVLYRDENGNPIALQNRCAHRSFPLDQSTLEEGGIRCRYHGIKYNHDGKIIDVPCQDKCPRTGIKKYKTKEIGPLVWVWMGDYADADEADIPELPVHDMNKWTHVVGKYNYMEGSYILLHENLCDLSHLPFLHASTFKFPKEYTAAPIRVEQHGNQVTFYRQLEDWNMLKPFFHPKLDFGNQKVLYKSGGKYVSPATNKGYGLLIPLDESGNEQPAVGHYVNHYLTPESERSCHYFWFIARNYALDDKDYSKKQGEMVQAGFDEDVYAIKLLQAMFERDQHDYREIGIKADKPGVIMRKIVKSLAGA